MPPLLLGLALLSLQTGSRDAVSATALWTPKREIKICFTKY